MEREEDSPEYIYRCQFPPIEDLNNYKSNNSTMNNEQSLNDLHDKLEKGKASEAKFYSEFSRLAINDSHSTYVNQDSCRDTYNTILSDAYRSICDAGKQVDHSEPSSSGSKNAMNSAMNPPHRYEYFSDVNAYFPKSSMAVPNAIVNSIGYNPCTNNLNFPSEEVEGISIYHLAKDSLGCEDLKGDFIEGSLEDSTKTFAVVISRIVELMSDPFGSKLVEAIIENCSKNQRSQIVHELAKERGNLTQISCHENGSRIVQKLIETLDTAQQIHRIISALMHNAAHMIKNANGIQVLQACLRCFSPEQNEFIFDAARLHCFKIATYSHSQYFLQNCIASSNDRQRTELITHLSCYIFPLALNQYGNNVVQDLLNLKDPWVTVTVLDKLQGRYASLLMGKYSSYVVEKCIKSVEERYVSEIVQEIMHSPLFHQILTSEFGNYAIQRALERTKGHLRSSLVDMIELYTPALQNHRFGKNIILCIRRLRRS